MTTRPSDKTPGGRITQVRVRQQNVNKSLIAQSDLLH